MLKPKQDNNILALVRISDLDYFWDHQPIKSHKSRDQKDSKAKKTLNYFVRNHNGDGNSG